MFRRAAVAGTWYAADPVALAAEVDEYLARAPSCHAQAPSIRAAIAPHAGLMYSGPTAAATYAAVRGGGYDAIVLVGPSHYVGFDGVAAWPDGAFGTPLGPLAVAQHDIASLVAAVPSVVTVRVDAHAHEHSLEMQLPFLARLFPATPIVPLVMGEQTRETIDALAAGLAAVFRGRQVLLVASSDLSHFFDRDTARALDGRVARAVGAFDPDALMENMERYPLYERGRYVMCGGGPVVAVMRAARALGATGGTVLAQADSSAVSGDVRRVVGYLAAVFGTFAGDRRAGAGAAGPC